MILIMGPSGAGKSVQGKMLVETLGYHWLSVGAALREHMQDPQVKEQINRGELINNKIVEEIVAKTINSYDDPKKVILDGFPRDHDQAQWLVGFCANNEVSIEAVIHLVVDLEVARQRLHERGREDDRDESIDVRFNEYQNVTQPILEYLDNQGIEVLAINGEQTIEEVHQEIVEAVKSVHQG